VGGWVTLCQSEGVHQIVIAFSPPVVGCLLKNSLQKGGSRAPQVPLATPLGTVRFEDALLMRNRALNCLAMFVQVKRHHVLPDKPIDVFLVIFVFYKNIEVKIGDIF